MKRSPKKKLYVKWEQVRSDDEPYLVACPKAEDLGELNESILIGVYELVNKGTLVTKPEILFGHDEAGE